MANKRMITEKMRSDWKAYQEQTKAAHYMSKEDITCKLLENQLNWCSANIKGEHVKDINESRKQIVESTAPGQTTADQSVWTPRLINMARRMGPNPVGMVFAGVQPMNAPQQSVFCLRARKGTPGDGESWTDMDELFMGEADSGHTGDGTAQAGDPSFFDPADVIEGETSVSATVGSGMTTATAELLGSTTGNAWARVGVTIQDALVKANSRGVFADFTTELRDDMYNVHGVDVDTLLSDIMVTEITAQTSREIIRKINFSAKLANKVSSTGVIDMATMTSGRWALEKWKYLLFLLEVEGQQIAIDTRMGKANKVLCHPIVASAFVMAGLLDYSDAFRAQAGMDIDVTGQTYVGRLATGLEVYIDPYAGVVPYATLAYKGAGQMDAGMYYAPYVPVEIMRANGEDTFQPRMAVKTRYGLAANPFVQIDATQAAGTQVTTDGITANSNPYFRKMAFKNMLPTAA